MIISSLVTAYADLHRRWLAVVTEDIPPMVIFSFRLVQKAVARIPNAFVSHFFACEQITVTGKSMDDTAVVPGIPEATSLE